MLRRIAHWWHIFKFKRRWLHVYPRATRVEGVANLYLSVCDANDRPRVMESCRRVWQRMDGAVRTHLEEHWDRLQKGWDLRETSIPLHIPIFGVFDGTGSIAGVYGTLSGWATISGFRCGLDDSPEHVSRLFAGLFLPIWDSHLQYTDAGLDLEMARRFASYYLWSWDRGEFVNYNFLWHKGTDELVKSWSFDPAIDQQSVGTPP